MKELLDLILGTPAKIQCWESPAPYKPYFCIEVYFGNYFTKEVIRIKAIGKNREEAAAIAIKLWNRGTGRKLYSFHLCPLPKYAG